MGLSGGSRTSQTAALHGDLIDGVEAKRIGLVHEAVPEPILDATVDALVQRIAGVPLNQLMMSKMMINHSLDGMGLPSTQMLARLFDGIARHTPDQASGNLPKLLA